MSPSRRLAITLEQCWHDVPGGTASSALESIRALQHHSDLELIGVSARHGEPPPPEWTPPLPVRALPLPRNLLYESWHRLRWPKVQRATGPVDVIHVTGMAMPPKSAPMVVTVHDLAFLHDPGHFTKHGVAFFHRAIDLARKDADIVICPSQATLDDCAANGFDPARLRLVPWGIEIDPAPPEEVARVRRRLGIERPYVFWTGTIEPRKNLSTLLDAFGRLDRDDIDLVIGGPEGWNDELAVLERRAGDRVKRIGFQPVPDLRAVYAGASVFCYPSLREGFGLPVLEAMAQGTPVITSAGTATGEVIGGPADVDGDECGVLVDPLDVDALTVALAGLLDDPARAAAVGAAGLARARTFTWERTAALLVSAYDEAIGAGVPA
jgi:glycosyltransferase involved in cell wall biosynthesis